MPTKLLAFALISTAALADIVNISPTSLYFGSQFVGSRSSQPVTLTNSIDQETSEYRQHHGHG